MAIIRVIGLSKQFTGLRAVDDLSFEVQKGEVYGFLGQNGAGKSTTIRMLLTLITPTSGEIELFGRSLRHHRREALKQVGAVIERPDLYKYLTAFENLSMFAKLSGKSIGNKQLLSQLDIVGLGGRAHSKVRTYSQGMKQRLGIAIALVHDPQLIILDEPTNGLDPQGIADMRRLILYLSGELGKTVLVSSHLLSEIEQIATRMIIIHKGKKVVEGSVQELFRQMEVSLHTTDDEAALQWLEQSPWKDALQRVQPDEIILKIDQTDIPSVVSGLVQGGIGILQVRPRNSLENYFLSLTSDDAAISRDRTI